MSTKKHSGHPHLSGEYRWGDTIQLILLFFFLVIWVLDSFVFHYSTFLRDLVPDFIRIPAASIVLFLAWILARRGMKAVFGTEREKPELINTGVFSVIRHPIYTGAILFYLGASLITLSILSVVFWLIIVLAYIFIARSEEKILMEAFGEKYTAYKKKTGMLFPRIFRS
ncbi:MAG: isoprenylcysteine carboxylmethyltransferase family protein [Bacteroides sp.]|nr:isoprenylcysteine carboxylmethyltransferase family protein [Bacteroides sp.]